mmetsp:Transcript_3064/g.9355  ORF Transcript_3064/g.9355 Transcript_3064/m.9355 type:complete len:157 (-) Transcript_3064:40-510(-)
MGRTKNRYMVGVVHSRRSEHVAPECTAQDLFVALRSALEAAVGTVGLGHTQRSMALKFFDPTVGTFLLRCSREHQGDIRTALCFVNRLPGKGGGHVQVVLRVVTVSGTVRSPKDELRRRTLAKLNSWIAEAKTLEARVELTEKKSVLLKSIQSLGP